MCLYHVYLLQHRISQFLNNIFPKISICIYSGDGLTSELTIFLWKLYTLYMPKINSNITMYHLIQEDSTDLIPHTRVEVSSHTT